MPYVVEDMFLAGIPQTILQGGLATRGISCHWTAGAPGRVGAVGTARYFVNNTRNASYHELWWWDAGSQTFGVLRIVSNNRAAHSMNPAQPPWEPTPLVREILGDKWWNPNSFSYAVSFVGMPADMAAACKSSAFVAYAARRIREILAVEPTVTHPRPLFNHGEGQPSTRYDWGTELRPLIYASLAGDGTIPDTSAEEDDMQIRSPIVMQEWDTVPGAVAVRSDGTTTTFAGTTRVKSIAEGTFNGNDSRLLDYGPTHVALVIDRRGLTNPGTRIVGSPTAEASGYTQAQYNQNFLDGKTAGRAEGIKAARDDLADLT